MAGKCQIVLNCRGVVKVMFRFLLVIAVIISITHSSFAFAHGETHSAKDYIAPDSGSVLDLDTGSAHERRTNTVTVGATGQNMEFNTVWIFYSEDDSGNCECCQSTLHKFVSFDDRKSLRNTRYPSEHHDFITSLAIISSASESSYFIRHTTLPEYFLCTPLRFRILLI